MGPKNLSLDALHREKWQERRDGDDHRKEDRLVHLDSCREDPVQAIAATAIRRMSRRVMRKVTENILHHDDGAVDDDAEVNRADRQQVGEVARASR